MTIIIPYYILPLWEDSLLILVYNLLQVRKLHNIFNAHQQGAATDIPIFMGYKNGVFFSGEGNK